MRLTRLLHSVRPVVTAGKKGRKTYKKKVSIDFGFVRFVSATLATATTGK